MTRTHDESETVGAEDATTETVTIEDTTTEAATSDATTEDADEAEQAATPDIPSPVAFGWAPRRALLLGALLTIALLYVNYRVSVTDAASLPEALRAVLVVIGMTVLPGIPVVVLLRIPGRALAAALVVSISLSANILAAQATMVTGHWNPVATQTGLLIANAVLTFAALVRLPRTVAVGRIGWRRNRWTRRRCIQLAVLAASLAALIVAGRSIDVLDVGALGVIGNVGPVYLLGLVGLATVLVTALRATVLDHVVLAATTALAVAYNTMLVALATGQTSVPNSFVHSGFISVLNTLHDLPTDQDARFSWAGFFTAGAHLEAVAGLPDTTGLLAWAPLYSGLLLSFGLYAIAVNITARARLAWLSVLIYHGFNWFQQDYFSPQAVAMLGYVAVAGALLWQLRAAPLPHGDGPWWRNARDATRRTPGRVPGFGPGRTLAVGAVLLVVVTANIVSHQMTPILLVLSLAAFTITGTTRYRTLWLAAGLIFAAWFSYGATDYWLGHLQQLFDEVGNVGNSVDRGVSDRLTGDPLYQRMQYLRMAASGGLVLLGGIGWWLWRHSRKRSLWVGALLCAAPGGLLVLQSYGGEMIIRAFLLSAPTVAPFAAMGLAAIGALAARYARARQFSVPRLAITAALVALVTAVSLLETANRGLNTAFEASTRGEVRVTADFMRQLPANTAVMTFSYAPHTVGVRRSLDPTGPRFGYIDSYPCLGDLATCTDDRSPDYVYITNQGMKMIELQYGRSEASLTGDIRRILGSGRYVVDTDTDSVLILRRTTQPQLDLPSAADEAPGRLLR
ncbi:MAG: hypothetical protein QM658_07680 [Gordonia sp. (in: high G+C Gram-positive bacteria)]